MTYQLIAVCDPTLDTDSNKETNYKKTFLQFFRKFAFELGIKILINSLGVIMAV